MSDEACEMHSYNDGGPDDGCAECNLMHPPHFACAAQLQAEEGERDGD